MYSKIQVVAMVSSGIACVILLWLAKQFHDMDAGYLPYFAFLGAFVCASVLKGVLLDAYDVSVEEEA
jgi:hypothetical protein